MIFELFAEKEMEKRKGKMKKGENKKRIFRARFLKVTFLSREMENKCKIRFSLPD